ncbi:1-phosphofructokinase family hexose kinase [Aminithiophilus ramosus]|uniref:1-phosphofructokinase family hexose kinase n=2 Tax=Synergistales TaxID=649776 RepID=A0A9Q7AKR7_9BACT|nr:1-phosphofructokinase family hexose kinase [Aminithiophilus ramosus]QTX31303.1 1-phosphofructokinase family hexose kinase [Aminithiophilus ramosus]QVL35104.1 1-phosphofructokinase family hexose kinase [Synergistota bacterium]
MIVTVTLNPAIDEEYVVPDFAPGGWFRATKIDRSPGGKGVNVSLVLKQLGYDSAAMGFLAGFNGEYVRDSLKRLGLTTNFVHTRGETRTNVYVVDEVSHVETGVAEAGPYITEEALGRFLINYKRLLKRADCVLFGGSLPPGVPQDIYRELIVLAREAGVVTFIDAAGAPLMAGLEGIPSFAKVDHRFMSRVAGVRLNSLDNLIEVVSGLHERGVLWAVANYRTCGDVFFTPEGIFLGEFGRKGIVSLFGSDDALMAGLTVGHLERMTVEASIRFALACAWENALHVEKGCRSRKAVEDLLEKVHVERLE